MNNSYNSRTATNVNVGNEYKVMLEQKLYNVIHQRNLFARCENQLNIQCRALAIEDKLSECHQNFKNFRDPNSKRFHLCTIN